jgi:predicted PurR-regulated permease PerM
MSDTRPSWSQQTRALVVLVVLVLACYLLYRFRAAVIPMVLASILAYVLAPLVGTLQRRLKIPRVPAILLVYLVMFGLLAGILSVVIPLSIAQVKLFQQEAPELYQAIKTYFGKNINIVGYTFDLQTIWDGMTSTLQSASNSVLGESLRMVTRVITSVVWVIFTMMISIYLLKDGADIMAWLQERIPPLYRSDFIQLKDDINTIWGAFFRGQLLLAVVVAAIMTSIAFILGLRYALILGLLAGVLEFLPSVGHGIWLSLAGLVALIGGSYWIPLPGWAVALILIGFHLFFQQFDLNYLIPRIIGRSVHLAPIVVILGIVAGASIAGVLGIVLAAPTIASSRVIAHYIYARLFDLDPFPDYITDASFPAPDLRWWQRHSKKTQPVSESKVNHE